MQKNRTKLAFAAFGSTMLLGVMLAGCSQGDVALENEYVPVAHYERYPISVRRAPVKMALAARAGRLTREQINATENFASAARQNAESKISISWPSGSAKARGMARDVAGLFVEQGVPHSSIRVTSYPGGASSPLRISYLRKVAVTPECGDWSDNLANKPDNTPYLNFGCATQHNIAAMVANPEDFQRPRAMSPVTAANRTAAMTLYYKSPEAASATPAAASDSASGEEPSK